MRDITWYNYSSWVYKPTYNILGGHATPCIHSIRHFSDSVNPRLQVIFCWMTTVIGCVLARSPSLDMVILIDKIVIHPEKHRLYIYIDSKRCFILGCCSTHLLAKIVDVKQRQLFQSTHWHSACTNPVRPCALRPLQDCYPPVWEYGSLGNPLKILMDATTWRIGTFLGRMDCFKSTCTQRNGETRNPRYAVDIQFVDHTGWKPTCSPELRMNCLPLGTLGFPGVWISPSPWPLTTMPTQKRPTQKPGSQNHDLVRI